VTRTTTLNRSAIVKKIIALTGLTAVLALAGCGQDSPDAKPAEAAAEQVEQVEPSADTVEAKTDDNVYSLTDENGTIYTLDLSPYSDDLVEETDKIIAEAMSAEGDVDAAELEDITEWASLTIDNTKSDMESGSSYVDIQIVGDEMQYGIITDPGMYFDELTSDYQISIDDTDAYNHIVDVSNEWMDAAPATVKPGVKVTYPIVLGDGLPETIESVWCWDQEMK
jgi:predicted small lipoprotein YifL